MKIKDIIKLFKNTELNIGITFGESECDGSIYSDTKFDEFAVWIKTSNDELFYENQNEVEEEYLEKECEFEGIQAVSNIKISSYKNDEYQGKIKKTLLMLVFSIVNKELYKEKAKSL